MAEEKKEKEIVKGEGMIKKMGVLLKMFGVTPDMMSQMMGIFETQQKKLNNCETMLIALCKKHGIEFE